jgi:hypothetical protein
MGMTAGGPIVIFGAGAGGRRAATHCARARAVQYLVDSDPEKQGTRVLDWDVRPPAAILATPDVSVIVASIHADQIFEQLLALGVPAQRIEIVNPDTFADAGRDPFPTGLAVVVAGFLGGVAGFLWWMVQ